MQPIVIEPLEVYLARTSSVDEQWLWCAECQRFFHLHSVHKDASGTPCCPFADCYGYGFNFTLFFWDTEREPEDARWPASAAELRHGMRSPEMSVFYEERYQRRMDELIAAFRGTPEHLALGAPEEVRFIRPFLYMLYCLSWDIDDEVCFFEDLAREVPADWPRWCEAPALEDAPRMLAELIAFWAFAERSCLLPHASRWLAVFTDNDALASIEEGILDAQRRRARRRTQHKRPRRPRRERKRQRAKRRRKRGSRRR